MPTRGRPHLLPTALHTFLEQDYEGDATLFVLDDSPAPWLPCCGQRPSREVVYLWEDPRGAPSNLATKRNRLARLALDLGDELLDELMFALWDDDDLHGPSRLTRQVGALLSHRDAELCLLLPWTLYDVGRHLVAVNDRVDVDAPSVFTRAYLNRGGWDERITVGAGVTRLVQQLAQAPASIVRVDGRHDYVVVRHSANLTPAPGASYQSGPWKQRPPCSPDELATRLRTAAVCRALR